MTEGTTLSPEDQEQVIRNTVRIVREYYVIPETGEKIAQHIEKKSESGSYSGILEVSKLCRVLTNDIREVYCDFHVALYQDPEEASRLREQGPNEEEDPEQWYEGREISNFGIKRAEYLEGNIGYLDLRLFAPVSLGRDAAMAAMKFLENSDALIFDLRHCEGGDPWQVQLFESYLFEEPPKLLLTLYNRSKDSHQQIHTIPHLPGKRLPDAPVYILTSHSTFSGGEDFSYTLKHHGRAKVVGEITGGGGNTVDHKVVHGDIVIQISTGHPIHPVTKSNWEGTGVEPDIPVSHDEALKVAHIDALETLIQQSQDDTCTTRLKWFLEQVRVKYSPVIIPPETMSRYIGKYRHHDVYVEHNSIIVHDTRRECIWKLIPLSDSHFAIENDDLFTVRFYFKGENKASKFAYVHWKSKNEISFERIA